MNIHLGLSKDSGQIHLAVVAANNAKELRYSDLEIHRGHARLQTHNVQAQGESTDIPYTNSEAMV
jgi:hypothetical protein